MTCHHIKKAKAEISKLLHKSLLEESDLHKTKGPYLDWSKLSAHFNRKKLSFTVSEEKVLRDKFELQIIDKVALSAHLNEINDLLEQCDCYIEAKIKASSLEAQSSLLNNTLKEREESSTALVRTTQGGAEWIQKQIERKEEQLEKKDDRIARLEAENSRLREELSRMLRYEAVIETNRH